MDRAVASGGLRQAPMVVADVALFYGEKSGGVRTYLDERARYARATGVFEHHKTRPFPVKMR